MRTPRSKPLDLLPPTGRRVGGKFAADAPDRRAVPEDPVLRESADDGASGAKRGGGQPQAGPAADGLDGLDPVRRTTVADPGARAYPYLFRDRVLTRVDEVWSSDITYVPMR